MTAEQQLERSVLEGKERDELHAIAQALSVKTTTRTKKADIIDGILKATGVAVDDGGTTNGGPPGGETAGNGAGSGPTRPLAPARTSSRKPRGSASSTAASSASADAAREATPGAVLGTMTLHPTGDLRSASEDGSGDGTSPTDRNEARGRGTGPIERRGDARGRRRRPGRRRRTESRTAERRPVEGADRCPAG